MFIKKLWNIKKNVIFNFDNVFFEFWEQDDFCIQLKPLHLYSESENKELLDLLLKLQNG